MVEKKIKTPNVKKEVKSENKKAEIKTDAKQDSKLKELKIELLKQTAKKKGIRREIARLFTLQNKNMGANK